MRMYVFIVAISLFSLVSCKKDNPEPEPVVNYLEINMSAVYGANGTQTLLLDSVYTTPEGYKIKFTDIKCYFTLLQNDGTEFTQAAYYDLREKGSQVVRIEGDYSKFSSLQGVIGVDSSVNHDDPSAFPNDSPLNISNAGPMHWGWNTGYIFFNIEGKADTLIDGMNNLNHSFSFHIGTDAFARPLNFSNLIWTSVGSNTHITQWKLNMHKFLHELNPVDLRTEFLTHTAAGQQTLTEKITSNFSQSISPF
ncbi:MAG: hypothetical protein FJX99_00290 [Bacteroidetes bacterium]|nr:hypothetical protein [Bacteroidota bacterium]